MKKLVVLIASVLPLCGFAQEGNYTIKGTVGKLNAPAKAFLMYRVAGENVTDSAVIKNGAFELKGTLKDPFKGYLIVDHNGKKDNQNVDKLELYVEKGNIVVTSSDSIQNAKISGSPINEANQKLMASLKPMQAQQDALEAEYMAASDEKKKSKEFMEELQAKSMAISEAENQVLISFIKSNSNSYLSMDALRKVSGAFPDLDLIEPLYNQLSAEIKSSENGVDFANKIASWKLTSVGAIAPDFTQNDVNGNPVSLSSFRGKYVLLDFWASWCGPCRKENPMVVKAYNEFKDKNFTIIGVSLDSGEKGKDTWLKAIEKDQLDWTQLSDLKGWKNEVAQKYAVQSIPQNFLLDPNGKIIAKNLRGEDLAQKLAEILK